LNSEKSETAQPLNPGQKAATTMFRLNRHRFRRTVDPKPKERSIMTGPRAPASEEPVASLNAADSTAGGPDYYCLQGRPHRSAVAPPLVTCRADLLSAPHYQLTLLASAGERAALDVSRAQRRSFLPRRCAGGNNDHVIPSRATDAEGKCVQCAATLTISVSHFAAQAPRNPSRRISEHTPGF